ncbi:Multidrug resistance protein stp [Mycobacterium marinum]|uniref:Multidrug resistance protein stp n=1 Tax=Mycobacterium marinum TaxID=1781 RepID=A0A3E2MUU7_MYCMR|nr:MFS transporter [Mycobacterium marinum]RFZ40348.1 Multidrug resistance protein stp [Mycobacterium marinum]
MAVQPLSPTKKTPPVGDAEPDRPGRLGGPHFRLGRRRQPSPATVLLVAAFGAFLAFLDSTIVNVAFPDIQRYFHSGISDLSWVLNAYNIVFAAFLVAAGKLADLLGRKRLFVYGVVLFTIASGLCAAADSVEQLVAFRVLQGIGAAVLVPASLGLVVESFPAERRAHGVNLWGAAGAIAAGLGPPIGGALVEALNWRWVFLVNLPLGIVAVLAARRALVESRACGRRRVPDVRGAALLATALGLLTLGLIKGPDWGWSSLPAIGSLVAAALAMIGFLMSSRSHPTPLVEPALLRIRSFVAGSALTAIASAGFYAYLLTHVLFLNYVWGYTLLQAGLAVCPAAIIAAVTAGLLGRVADRHGYRVIVGVGALIWAGSLLWYLTCVGTSPNFLGEWLPGQILQGFGVGAAFPLLGSAALAGLASGSSYATASAVTGTIRQVGAVIGVALLVILVGTPAPGAAEESLRRGWTMAAICFVAVALGAVWLGRIRPAPAEAVTPESIPPAQAPLPQPSVAPVVSTSRDIDVLQAVPDLQRHAEHVELQAGSYLFRAGDVSDSLYVVRSGRLQVIDEHGLVAELGRGQLVGEVGVLRDAPRSASVLAVRDSSLLRVPKSEFAKIADARLLGVLASVLANRQVPTSRTASRPPAREVVVAVIGVDAGAPATVVATELCAALSQRLRAVAPGRVNADGLERAERSADRVVLQATVGDGPWLDFCVRVADRVVLVARDFMAPPRRLTARAPGVDLVLTGPSAAPTYRREWEELITPRSVHTVHPATIADDLRPLAARIAGRSVGLVLGGGGALACAHLGVLEELEAAGITVDRYAGTSMGALMAALAADGVDAAGVDAYMYEYFVRKNHSDFTLPSKGFLRGKRTEVALRSAFGDRLVEELPKQFRCVSVDLLARQSVVHRSGLLTDVISCSMRLPVMYPPMAHAGSLHVDGGILNNVPVTALAGPEGPVIAVNVAGGNRDSAPDSRHGRRLQVPGITDTLLRALTIGSAMTSSDVLAHADVVIQPNPSGIGFLEFHQIDRAREAGRMAARQALPQIMKLVFP